jgi:hypothetical protein
VITADYAVFPANVVASIWNLLGLLDPDVLVVMRPVKEIDPVQTIGIFAVDSEPIDNSQEIRGQYVPGVALPTLTRYGVNIQVKHTDGDMERGIMTHSAMTNIVTSTVARNDSLRLLLASLSSTYSGMTESFQQLRLERVRYMSGELGGQFQYMSVCEYSLQTEQK